MNGELYGEMCDSLSVYVGVLHQCLLFCQLLFVRCYCPCSKKMESWRKRFGVPGFDEVWSTNATTHACCSTNKFSPHGLLCHLRTKAEGGQFIHEMIDQYLRYLYTDYLDDGSKKRNHKALYDVNSSNYKMAEAMENRKIRR